MGSFTYLAVLYKDSGDTLLHMAVLVLGAERLSRYQYHAYHHMCLSTALIGLLPRSTHPPTLNTVVLLPSTCCHIIIVCLRRGQG